MNDTMNDRALVPAREDTKPPATVEPLTVKAVLTYKATIARIMDEVLKKDVHYGVIPGCNKPSLYQPGAEVLLVTFRMTATFPHELREDLSSPGVIRYRVCCRIVDQQTGRIVYAESWAECSSEEDKYAWQRAVNDKEYDAAEADKRRIKYYKNGSTTRQVRTNPADVANTILMMAQKRAMVAAARRATGASDFFDIGLEDLPESMRSDFMEQESATLSDEQRADLRADAHERQRQARARQLDVFDAASLSPAQIAAGQTVLTRGDYPGRKLIECPVSYVKKVYEITTNAGMKHTIGVLLGMEQPTVDEEPPTTNGQTEPAFAGEEPEPQLTDEDGQPIGDPFADQ